MGVKNQPAEARLTVETLNLQHRDKSRQDFGFGSLHHLLVSFEDTLQDEGQRGQDIRSCSDHAGDRKRSTHDITSV